MLRMLPVRCNIASAVVHLVDEFLNALSGGIDAAALLDHFRRRLNAAEAVVWRCDGIRARSILHSSSAVGQDPLTVVDLDDGAVMIQRLRHAGAVLCRAGELTGLERLVPPGVQSFAAAATNGRDPVTRVLVIGWTEPVLPCATSDSIPLRVAVSLLADPRIAAAPAAAQGVPADAILASLPDPIAVVDREGIIHAVNPAWLEFAGRQGGNSLNAPGPGMSYVEVCARAATSATEIGAVLTGVTAVAAGVLDEFQTASFHPAPDGGPGTLMRVTPLRHPRGGAVISHVEVTDRIVNELADQLGQARFEQFADGVPVPTLIIGLDGRVLYANQQWSEATGDRAGRSPGTASWTDAMDAPTRIRATAALESAARSRVSFQLEVRLKSADGIYRWWMGTFAPRYAPDGAVVSYVGVCQDATATRQVRTAFGELAGKLVAAQEAERSRIARELHDDIGQQIALLSARLETARNLKHGLADARSRLQKIASDLSSLSHELHPGKVKLLGLARTLESLCRDMSLENGIQIDFDARHVPSDLAEDTAVSLFRVAQEALRNAVKHSGATAIAVRLGGTPSQLTLKVTDNGNGFDPLASQASGLGLLTMRERMELVGGTLAVEAARPRGTTVRVVVPLALQAAPAATPRSDAAAPLPESPPPRTIRRASAARDPGSTAS